MRSSYTVRPLLWVAGGVLLVVVVVTVIVVQAGQRSGTPADEPAGDRQVQVSPDGVPRSAGGGGGADGLTAWASAAAAGDFATARRYMEDDELMYTFWKDDHEDFASNITGYRILRKETIGQTTTAVVGFDTTSGNAHCIEVQVDEPTQKVRIDKSYGDCPAQ